jgi:hypothetical protein
MLWAATNSPAWRQPAEAAEVSLVARSTMRTSPFDPSTM